MRSVLLVLALSTSALAQPVDATRDGTHTVEVADGDALLIRLANRFYGPASDVVAVTILQPDGEVYGADPEEDPYVSVWLTDERSAYEPRAMPGTWTVQFSDEPTGARERLTLELVAGAPTLSLHEAVTFHDLDALRAAIERAEGMVDEPNGSHQTALMLAADAGDTDAVRLLLAAGADARATAGTEGGAQTMTMTLETPLHYAARSGHADVARLLLDAGADPNATTAEGYTPLHWAVYAASLDAVVALLDAGAESVESESGTPAEIAADQAENEWTDAEDRPALREIARLLVGE